MAQITTASSVSRWVRVGIAAATVSATLAIGGCKKGDETSAGGGGGGKAVTLAFVCNNSSDFWTIARAGTRQAEKETPGLKVDFQIPSKGEAADQKQILEAMLAKGVDGVAISPVDPAHETDILNEVAAHGVLFCQDSDAPQTKRTCYVGTDNKAAGRQAGEQVKKALPGGGKVMVFVGRKDAQNAHDRFTGLQEALAGSNVTIADEKTDEEDRMKAKANVQNAIVNNPEVNCFVGLWSYNGPQILAAVREAKKTGTIKIVCFDEEQQTLDGVKAGDVECTIVQQPYEFGRISMETMAKYVRGDKSVVPANQMVIIDTKVIAKGDVDAFSENLAKQKAAGK